MNIDNLKAFIAVAETGSFSRAAEQLYLTQPAVSKRVATLESDLDTRLFDRIGHQIILTESGQALLPRARAILLDIEDTRRAIGNLSGAVGGSLRIGTSHHIGLHRLPPVLKMCTHEYPEIRLDLRFMDSEAACQAVEHGDLELGIVTLPLSHSDELITRAVWPDPLSVVVAHEHPLARKTPGLETLLDHQAVLPSHGTFTRSVIEQALGARAEELKISLSTNYLETLLMLVTVGLGWSVLPDNMISDDVVKLDIPELGMQRTLGIVRHRDRTLSNAGQVLLDIVDRIRSA
jgi:DNA-binding transcriptional LysR family regulator